jgi:T-complex protein 1 subunit delta
VRPIPTSCLPGLAYIEAHTNAPAAFIYRCITDIQEENVLQPALVTISALTLATETVRSILKIDDIVHTR